MRKEEFFCPWDPPIFFLFSADPGIPILLYYAYIPIILTALFFTSFVFIKDHYSKRSTVLLLISLFFTGSILNNIFEWTSNNVYSQMFSWQLTPIFELSISLLSLYFVALFLEQGRTLVNIKRILIIAFLPVIFLLSSKFNVQEFYLTEDDCGGVFGILWRYVYAIELICVFATAYLCFQKYYSSEDKSHKLQILFLGVGSSLFLSIFFVSNIFGEMTKTYEINLIGPFGMIIFLSMLSYMIIKFKTFNAKIFASQALVIILWLLVAGLLLIQSIEYIHLVVLFTLVLVSLVGYNLIKGIKKEIDQREKIEKLAIELKNANEKLRDLDRQKDDLLSIVSHQLATPVSAAKWTLELMQDDPKNKLNKEQKENLKSLQNIMSNLSDLVSMILDVSRIQLGRMRMDKQELDLNIFFKEILEIIEPKAKEKKVKFLVSIPKKFSKAALDKRYTHMTFENLLSNAIKYTPEKGNVSLNIEVKNNIMFCTIKDTGVGIPKQEQSKIFGKMFRASNVRNSVDGNGFGLYVAKGAIEAQGGKIWFESEEGKGTTFFVKLPLSLNKAN